MEIKKILILKLFCLLRVWCGRLLNEPICGRPTAVRNRIIGGHAVKLGEFPWMALTRQHINETMKTGCGASLINDLFLLSAAHCFEYAKDYPKTINVYLGFVSLPIDPSSIQEVQSLKTIHGIKKVHSHNAYQPSNHIHDVALLQLVDSIAYTATIKPICLPLKKQGYNVTIKIGHMGIVAGWGCTQYGGQPSNKLLKANVKVRSLQHCRISDDNWNAHRLCAGVYNVTDACKGDSGGPLMKKYLSDGHQRYFHFGTVSGNYDDAPNDYTRTSYYAKWIKGTIQDAIFKNAEGEPSCS